MPATPHGHWWTIAPDLLARVRAPVLDERAWSLDIPAWTDERVEHRAVTIAGRISRAEAGDGDLFLLVHGLGGDAERPYMRAAAAAIQARGHPTLRMSMRGAGDSGPDFYHAGLWTDIEAILAADSLAHFERVFVLGFSLGGHVAAHLALQTPRDPRLTAVIAICAPLDLARNVEVLDAPSGWIYRRFVLDSLAAVHAKVHGRRPPRFRSIRQWDAATVVPRFGFDDVEHYWATQAAGPRLREAKVPILFVATEGDPMVPAETLEPYLRRAGPNVDVRWLRRGGHVGFPADTDLGLPGELGLLNQVLTWCERL